MQNLRRLILSAEHYRQSVSTAIGLGTTESQAITCLALNGELGQTALARNLQLTSSSSTALVDRLERQGVAERMAHPSDRRQTIVRLTARGREIASQSEKRLSQALELLPRATLADFSGGLALLADDLEAVARLTAAGEIDPIPTHALPAA